MIRVHMWPEARGQDDGQGGVRRVVEGLQNSLPAQGIQLVGNPADADILACHITMPREWLRKWPRKLFVAHCHGLYWSEFEWPSWCHDANREVLAAITSADAVTVPTDWVARAIRRHTARDPVVIGHGIDASQWQGRPVSPAYILWDKTRPDPVCDPDHMNEVAKLLPERQFVSTFGRAAPNVTIVGHKSYAEAALLHQGASAYLSTARETFGVSILQALACGVPVVGWRWGGAAEIVTDGVDGFLVRPHDYAALAVALEKAMVERDSMAAACRETAARWSWERAAAQYAGLYRQLAERRAAEESSPRTSIVVTAYKLAQYLPDALDSVEVQTDPDWECVVVDDDSPDDCGAIADAYAAKDKRFRVIHNETNQYLAGARNTGIAAARGRYIIPLDADDQLTPHTLAHLAAALDERVLPKIGRPDGFEPVHAVYGNVRFTEEDGRTPVVYRRDLPAGNSGWPEQFVWERQLSGQNLMPYCSMFTREAWRLTGGYRGRCRTAEDADLWCRLASYGFRARMVTTADTLIYRNRESSMSRLEAPVQWHRWFPWHGGDSRRAPAGAGTRSIPPVPSLDPPALSVVIPVGPGHERLVTDAVDSVEAQTFRGWEIIVVNDSGKSLAPLPSWVRIIETEGRTGVAHARNVGVAAARARYYLPLDADDMLEPECLEFMFEVIRKQPGIVAYSDFWEDPSGPGQWQVFRNPDWDPELLVRIGQIGAVTQLIPVDAWRTVGGYDEQLPAWEDWAFHIALADRGYCSTRIPLPLWTYRKYTGRRREENMAAFEDSKAAILRQWDRLWKGGERFMACSGCRKGAASTSLPSPESRVQAAPAGSSPNGLTAILYDGPLTSEHSYRSPKTSTRYYFKKGSWAYVKNDDVDWLLNLRGMSRYTVEQVASMPARSAPELASVTRQP